MDDVVTTTAIGTTSRSELALRHPNGPILSRPSSTTTAPQERCTIRSGQNSTDCIQSAPCGVMFLNIQMIYDNLNVGSHPPWSVDHEFQEKFCNTTLHQPS